MALINAYLMSSSGAIIYLIAPVLIGSAMDSLAFDSEQAGLLLAEEGTQTPKRIATTLTRLLRIWTRGCIGCCKSAVSSATRSYGASRCYVAACLRDYPNRRDFTLISTCLLSVRCVAWLMLPPSRSFQQRVHSCRATCTTSLFVSTVPRDTSATSDSQLGADPATTLVLRHGHPLNTSQMAPDPMQGRLAASIRIPTPA